MKTALITGTSYGIGEEIAKTLLANGWKVYGLSRSTGKIRHKNFHWVKCDLSDTAQIKASLTQVSEDHLDALISNAGVINIEDAAVVTESSFQKTFSVNVLAPMLLIHYLKNKVTKATIISISSVADRIPEPSIAFYCSSKAANTSYFNSIAQEFKKASVFTILPDYVDTPMLHSTMDGDKTFDWSCTIKPADIASLSYDLISGKRAIESGSNIIVVTESLKNDLKSVEKLHGFNTDTKRLFPL